MKIAIAFFVMLCSTSIYGQVVKLTPNPFVVNSKLTVDILANPGKKLPKHSIIADIDGTTSHFKQDTIVSFQKPPHGNVYNIAIRFDTLTRYYQMLASDTLNKMATINERPYFRYPDTLKNVHGKLLSLMNAFTKTELQSANAEYILSFKLYKENDSVTVITVGHYLFSGNDSDWKSVKKYLNGCINASFDSDVLMRKFLSEIVASPLLINNDVLAAKHRYSRPEIADFKLEKKLSGHSIWSTTSADRVTIYVRKN